MHKHFLATVSNDFEHLTGVGFMCSFFKEISEHEITLLHISRLDSNDMNNALMEMWESPEEKAAGRISVGAKKALEKATEMLSRSRMSIDKMQTKTFAERYGKIKDILNEATKGLYDAIILGKRASYTMQWFFEKPADESALAFIKDSSLVTPLWVCPAVEEGRKNVLVCLDGSENSFRAVDHVGYILSKQDQHTLTLFHVAAGGGQDSEQLFQRAKGILHKHEVSDERINTASTWGLSVPGTILSTADKGGYAAIAVGVAGKGGGLLQGLNLSSGSTANLISKVEKVSLWCCP